MFDITELAIDAAQLRQSLLDNEQCGAFTSFEGWVRRQNDTTQLDYVLLSTILIQLVNPRLAQNWQTCLFLA